MNIIYLLQYMLHYLRSLQAWFGEEEWSKYPVAKTSMALLQDFHHSPAILDYSPNLIAIACINLSLQIYGVVVPLMDECDQQSWFNVRLKLDQSCVNSRARYWTIDV